MNKMKALQDVIKSRRGKGLDITILLGGHNEPDLDDEMKKDSDLAPSLKEESPGIGEDKDLPVADEETITDDDRDNDSSINSMNGDDFEDGISDYEKQQLMSPDHKPRSLGDRARQAFLMSKNKK